MKFIKVTGGLVPLSEVTFIGREAGSPGAIIYTRTNHYRSVAAYDALSSYLTNDRLEFVDLDSCGCNQYVAVRNIKSIEMVDDPTIETDFLYRIAMTDGTYIDLPEGTYENLAQAFRGAGHDLDFW